jgi:hypothetical protein
MSFSLHMERQWRGASDVHRFGGLRTKRMDSLNAMEFHVIKIRSNPVVTRAIHNAFFHGKAHRGGSFPTSKDYRLQHEVDLPMRLHKNAHNIAEVFCPEYELVVSERIAQSLKAASLLVDVLPIEFEILYSYPFGAGDLACGFLSYDDQMRFIDKRKDSKVLHEKVGRYFYVRTPPLWEVRSAFPEAPQVEIESEDRTQVVAIPASAKLFEVTPVFSLGAGYVMGEPFYEILASGIDWTYFTHAVRTVP